MIRRIGQAWLWSQALLPLYLILSAAGVLSGRPEANYHVSLRPSVGPPGTEY